MGILPTVQPSRDFQPVVTTIRTHSLPITKLDFPAITICNQGFNMKTMYQIHKLIPDKWDPWFEG